MKYCLSDSASKHRRKRERKRDGRREKGERKREAERKRQREKYREAIERKERQILGKCQISTLKHYFKKL